MIRKEILEKFKNLYKKKYHIDLTDEQTTRLANDLINIMRVLLKPEHKVVESEVKQEERRQSETIGTFQY